MPHIANRVKTLASCDKYTTGQKRPLQLVWLKGADSMSNCTPITGICLPRILDNLDVHAALCSLKKDSGRRWGTDISRLVLPTGTSSKNIPYISEELWAALLPGRGLPPAVRLAVVGVRISGRCSATTCSVSTVPKSVPACTVKCSICTAILHVPCSILLPVFACVFCRTTCYRCVDCTAAHSGAGCRVLFLHDTLRHQCRQEPCIDSYNACREAYQFNP